MQIVRRGHDEAQQKQSRAKISRSKVYMKTPGKTITVVVVTAAYLLFTSGAAQIRPFENESGTLQSVSAMPANMRILTDETVDTFALVYSMKILQTENYMLTMENRENIKRLLSGMGADNIEKLNEAIYSGNTDRIVEAVIQLADENFGWEETALMEQWQ